VKYQEISDAQAEQFLTKGYVRIDGAISSEKVQAWTSKVWTRLGYEKNDMSTWAQARIHMPSHERAEVKELAPRAWAAICDLCGGEERIQQPCVWGDGFIVNLGSPEDAEMWQAPSAEVSGWHKDGDWFKHFLDSPEQGLLTIVLWSDVAPQAGATFVAGDSVGPIAQFLVDKTDGVLPGGFPFKELIKKCNVFEEATGKAGDVYLIHPYLLHASSRNAPRTPRLITNPAIILREPMQFDRPDGNYSLVEKAILRGLGVERLPFAPTASRERVTPERVRIQQKMLEDERARLQVSG
jgi:hypothetical protein